MNPSPDEPADSETADEAAARLQEPLDELDQEILESTRRLATDPEHRARIQKLLVYLKEERF